MVSFFGPGETKPVLLRAIERKIRGLRSLERPEFPKSSKKRPPPVQKPREEPERTHFHLDPGDVVEAPSYPFCLFFTHHRCRLEHEKLHTDKYTHSYPDLSVDPKSARTVVPQPFSHYLVLHVVGEDEIVELSAVLLDSASLQVIDRFHRFVRPRYLVRGKLERYIGYRYGPWMLQSTWGLLARDFTKTLASFERWLQWHEIWSRGSCVGLENTALVAFRVDDVLGKIQEQCKVWGIPLPPYLSEWIDLRDNLSFYKTSDNVIAGRVTRAMASALSRSELGLDEAHSIARILQRLLSDGAVLRV